MQLMLQKSLKIKDRKKKVNTKNFSNHTKNFDLFLKIGSQFKLKKG